MPGEVCQDTVSARAIGAKFPCPGVSWRVPVSERVRHQLAFQFSVSSLCLRCVFPPFGRCLSGSMTRDLASHLSSLTSDLRRMCGSTVRGTRIKNY